jgi:hypothetical protein
MKLTQDPFLTEMLKKGLGLISIKNHSRLINKNDENFVKFNTDIPRSQMILFKDLKL